MKRTCVKHTDRIGAAGYHMELTQLPHGNNRFPRGAVGIDVLGTDSVNEKI